MVSFPASEGPKRLSSSPRDFSRIGLRALASVNTSTAGTAPSVSLSTSTAQRDGTYPDLTQLLTTARSTRKRRATSAWLPNTATRRSAQFIGWDQLQNSP